MTHIMANFGALDAGASQLKSGANELQATEQTQISQIMGSAEYWSDIAGGEGSLGATGQQWRMRSDNTHTEATQRSDGITLCNGDYRNGVQQACGIIDSMS